MGDILGFNSFSGPLVLGTGVLVVVGKQSGGQTKGRWRAGITEISTIQGLIDHITVLLMWQSIYGSHALLQQFLTNCWTC